MLPSDSLSWATKAFARIFAASMKDFHLSPGASCFISFHPRSRFLQKMDNCRIAAAEKEKKKKKKELHFVSNRMSPADLRPSSTAMGVQPNPCRILPGELKAQQEIQFPCLEKRDSPGARRQSHVIRQKLVVEGRKQHFRTPGVVIEGRRIAYHQLIDFFSLVTPLNFC